MAYEMAWTRLEKRFGNPRKLLTLVKQDLLDGPPIKEWDAKTLMSLCDRMYKCETSFQGWEKEELLNSEELLRSIFLRLPYKLRCQFVTITHGNGSGTFSDLRLLVENAASAADTEYGQLLQKSKDQRPAQQSVRRSSGPPGATTRRVCASTQKTESKVSLPQTSRPRANCGICKDEQHPLWKCEKFRGMQASSRRDYVKENNVCFNCLREGHRVTNCLTAFTGTCRVCNRRHHSLLHEERADDQAKTKTGSASERREKKEEPPPRMSACSATSRNNLFDRTIFKVVPVKVWASNPSHCVYLHSCLYR